MPISPSLVVAIPSNEKVHPQHPILADENFGLLIKKQPMLNPTGPEPVGYISPQTASQDRSLSTQSSPALEPGGLSTNHTTDLSGRGQAHLEAYPSAVPFVPFHLPRPRPPLIEIGSTDTISSAQSNNGVSPLTPSPSLDDTETPIPIPIIVQQGTNFQKALTEPSVVSLKLSSLSPLSPSWVKAATNRSPGKRNEAHPTSNKTLVRDVQFFATRPKLVSLG